MFRDQLAELDRDVARGFIAAPEADAARNEISRRLIGARDDRPAQPAAAARYLVLPVAALFPSSRSRSMPSLGQPHLPDIPLAGRLDSAVENNDFAALIAKVEQHLARIPMMRRAGRVLAPVYRQLDRYADAALAYRRFFELSSATAAALADYGEMLPFANEGLVDGMPRRSSRKR